MQCDSGPSFPASPLIQDDGLLRRDFARRGVHAVRRGLRGSARSPSKQSRSRGRLRSKSLKNTDNLTVTAGNGCATHVRTGGSSLSGNDTEGRDGFVKMARFQLLHCTTSQLIRIEEMGYSSSFRRNQKKNDF